MSSSARAVANKGHGRRSPIIFVSPWPSMGYYLLLRAACRLNFTQASQIEDASGFVSKEDPRRSVQCRSPSLTVALPREWCSPSRVILHGPPANSSSTCMSNLILLVAFSLSIKYKDGSVASSFLLRLESTS